MHKKLMPEKLIQYGFKFEKSVYVFKTEIMNGDFALIIKFNESGNPDTALIEKDTNEEYVLYKTFAFGSYVGEIRTEITEILEDIANKCFETSVFKQEQTLHLIDYVWKTYGDEVEYLWKKLPSNGVWRRKDTKKWYGAILTTEKNKFGIDSNEKVEILDLHTSPKKIEEILKQKNFYPGWHMNKKSWFTVILDGSVNSEKLYKLIEESYNLAAK